MTAHLPCPLCQLSQTQLLWTNRHIHVIAVDDSGFPGYTRVIWAQHRAEMTDLSSTERDQLMAVVWQVELAQRQVLQPDKVNLAQLGNMVPHVHWHIIPRWVSDTHFPEAIWASKPSTAAAAERIAIWEEQQHRLQSLLPDYHAHLLSALNTLG